MYSLTAVSLRRVGRRQIMSYNARGLLGWLLVSAALMSTPALAGDVDDLKATFGKGVEAYNNRDDAHFAAVQDQSVFYAPTAPFATKGKEAYQKSMKTTWAATESSVFKPIDPQFLVVGSTGIVWGHYAIAIKPKDGAMRTRFGRYTITYSKSDGKWLAVASHYSLIPSGN